MEKTCKTIKKLTSLHFGFFSFLLFIYNPVQALADPATAAGLSPHQAMYEIELSSSKSGSQIVNVSGQMLYEWKPECDAWISDHRFNLAYEYADSPSMQITSDFSIYEPFDMQTINFTSQRKRNGVLFEESRGQARRGDPNKDVIGEAIFSKPSNLRHELPAGTVFPMSHSLGLLEAIKRGDKFYKAYIFDGSDQEGPSEVNAFIGQKVDIIKEFDLSNKNMDQSLLNSPAYRVRLAFFPANSQSEIADYEMSIIFHENGVISNMVIEYEDFSVKQKLVALEALKSSCLHKSVITSE